MGLCGGEFGTGLGGVIGMGTGGSADGTGWMFSAHSTLCL